MMIDLECPICGKITPGILSDEWWEVNENTAHKYYSVQCMDCDVYVDFEETYKTVFESQKVIEVRM